MITKSKQILRVIALGSLMLSLVAFVQAAPEHLGTPGLGAASCPVNWNHGVVVGEPRSRVASWARTTEPSVRPLRCGSSAQEFTVEQRPATEPVVAERRWIPTTHVDDCRAEYKRLLSLGGEVLGTPVADENGHYVVYCRDPFGNIIELAELPDDGENPCKLEGISCLGNYEG